MSTPRLLQTSKNSETPNRYNKMKTLKNLPSSLKVVAAVFLLGLAAVPAHAQLVVSISGTSESNDQPIIDFLNNNFTNITSINYGDYSNPANIPVGTDVFMVGRNLSSTAYASSTNSATFNALTIPIVAFTSFVTRPDSDRWGWHSGGTIGEIDPTGSETTVTAAGAVAFGLAAGAQDFWTNAGTEFALGSGTVGTGDILATIPATNPSAQTGILAAGWTTGEQSAGGATFGGNRLLWNVFQVPGSNPTPALLPDNIDGQVALRNAISFYTPLNVVPEPGTFTMLLGGVGMLALFRRSRRK